MLGNRATQFGVVSITGGAGNRTLGYDPGMTAPPDLLVVSTSGTATITLPQIAIPNYGELGFGDAQILRIQNLAAQTVILAPDAADSILGRYAASATIAQNATAVCITKATSATAGVWYTS